MTDTDRTYTKGETFFLPVTIYKTGTPDTDGEVRATTDPLTVDHDIYVPASALIPSDRVLTAHEGYHFLPSDEWAEGQWWFPTSTDPANFTPFTHPPLRTDRTHIMVRDTPATERVPWHAAVGRTLPDGRTVHKAGISSTYPHGAVSTSTAESLFPALWLSADDDGTVEVRR